MNPNSISKTTYKVSDFVNWQKLGILVLSPKFQRRSVWKPGAKSFFIDTIYRGLPVPIIFLRDNRTDLTTLQSKREVIDGQQRLRTLLGYISHELLPDFNPSSDAFTVKAIHNQALANKMFDELNEEARQKILEYEFSVHILASGIDDREVLEMFSRMNATGVKLNRQELRNAEFYGYFKTTAYDLALEQLPRWRSWKVFNDYQIARMDEVEFTSDLMGSMIDGVVKQDASRIDSLYSRFDDRFDFRDNVSRRFRGLMDTIEDNFGRHLAKSILKRKTVFYGFFMALYTLAYGDSGISSSAKPKSVQKSFWQELPIRLQDIERKEAPVIVQNSISKRTGDLASRQTIVNYFLNG